LKIVLLTKPPFDYQHDSMIDMILNECPDIDNLALFISTIASKEPKWKGNTRGLWKCRAINLKRFNFKERNKLFFAEFWGTG
jgi:hypothetical protein